MLPKSLRRFSMKRHTRSLTGPTAKGHTSKVSLEKERMLTKTKFLYTKENSPPRMVVFTRNNIILGGLLLGMRCPDMIAFFGLLLVLPLMTSTLDVQDPYVVLDEIESYGGTLTAYNSPSSLDGSNDPLDVFCLIGTSLDVGTSLIADRYTTGSLAVLIEMDQGTNTSQMNKGSQIDQNTHNSNSVILVVTSTNETADWPCIVTWGNGIAEPFTLAHEPVEIAYQYPERGIYKVFIRCHNVTNSTDIIEVPYANASMLKSTQFFDYQYKHMESPLLYIQTNIIKLSANVNLNRNVTGQPQMNWRVAMVDGDDLLAVDISQPDSSNLVLPAGNLDIGDYLVVFEIVIPDQVDAWADDYMFLRVVLPDLIAHLEGGDYITVPHGSLHHVNGTASGDPFQSPPSFNLDELNIFWNCGLVENMTEVYAQPFFLSPYKGNVKTNVFRVANGTQTILEIDTSIFPEYSWIVVMLTVERGTRRATALQFLNLVPDVVSFTVRCVYNCHSLPHRKWNYDKIEMDTVLEDPLVNASSYDYHWSVETITTRILCRSADLKLDTPTGFNQPSFMMSKYSLEEGCDYAISVSISGPGNNTAAVRIEFHIGIRPYGGVCSVSPRGGVATMNMFKVNCHGWKGLDHRVEKSDQDQNAILTYRVIQYVGGAVVSREPVIETRSLFDVILKVGNPDSGYANDVIVEILDIYRNRNEVINMVHVYPSINISDETPDDAGAAVFEDFDAEYRELQTNLYSLANVDQLLPLAISACSQIHLIDLPIVATPVPANLNNDGFIMDLNPDGNKDIGTVEEAIQVAENLTVDPATLAIQKFLEEMTVFAEDFIDEHIVTSTIRKYDPFLKSQLTNLLSNIMGKRQFVNSATQAAILRLADIIGVSSLEDIGAADTAEELENAANEVVEMYHTVTASAVPDTLRNNRPVTDLKSGRKQVSDMIKASGATFDLDSSEFTEDERAYLYMKMQLELRLKTDGRRQQAKKAADLVRKLMKSIQKNLPLCDRCDNTGNERTKQRVAKDTMEKLASRNFTMSTSTFQLGGLGELRDNVTGTKSSKGSVSATELAENVYMYDNDGKCSFASSNILRIDVEAEETYVIPGYVTFEMTVETPEAQLTSPFVDPEDASELSLHRFLYQTIMDYVCFMIQPVSLVDVVIAKYDVYINFAKAPTALEYDVIVSVSPRTDWMTCLSPDKMGGHTGLTFLGVHVPGPAKQVNYTFTLATVACMVWDETQTTWMTDKCELEWLPVVSKIRCFCRNVTELTFANSFYVAPNSIDFSSVFLKFSPLEQAAVIGTLVGIFVIFILAVIFLKGIDRLDVLKWGVYPLIDNQFESDHFYLIQVYTGMRRGAGTRSSVGINLTGDKNDSGIRHLFNGIRQEFSTGSVMTFLMATPSSLGSLDHLYIWHDNTGQGDLASWYLDHVTIYDVARRETSTFIAERWLSVENRCDAKLNAVSQATKLQFESRFFGQTRRQLSDNHMWMSILYRPQSSPFTRVQRASCALCFILLSMIANAMYFNPDSNYQSPPLFQVGPFRFTNDQVYISIICALITTPAVMLLVFLFKHTRQAPPSVYQDRKCCKCWPPQSCGAICCCSSRKIRSRRNSYIPFASNGGEQDLSNSLMKHEDELLQDANLSTGVPLLLSGFSLHYRFIYVAWLLVAACVSVSSFFILLYSMEWGKQKSEEWLSAICMSILESMVLIDPVLVVFMAMLLACLVRTHESHLNFDVQSIVKNYKAKIGQDKGGIDMCLQLLKRIRTDHDPSVDLGPPPEGQELAEATQRAKLHGNMSSMCWNLIINSIFMLIVFGICYNNRDAHAYNCHNHVVQQIVDPASGPLFMQIKSRGDFFAWLNTTALPRLFPEKDYTGGTLHWSSRLYTDGHVNLRLGPPRVRQLRVHQAKCKLPYFGTVSCYDGYAIHEEFTEDLCIGWTKMPCSQIMIIYNESLPAWSFTSALDIWGLPIVAEFNTYGGGGYIANFDVSGTVSMKILNELFYQTWLDRQTRAVMLEFTLYNAGTRLFVYCEFMVEFPETGGALPSYTLYPLRPYHLTGPTGNFVLLLEVLFCVFVIVQIVKLSLKFYGERCSMFLRFWVWYDAVMCVMCFVTVVLFCIRFTFATMTIDTYREDRKEFVNFAHVVFWDQTFMAMAAIVVFVATLRILEVFSSSKKIDSVVRIISDCRGDLLQFGIFFAYVLLAFCLLGYLLFGDQLSRYKNVYRSVSTLLLSLLGKNRFTEMVDGFPILAKVFFFVYTVCTFFFVMTMFMSILGSSVDTVVHDMRNDTSDDIIEYIGKKLKFLLFRPTKKHSDGSADRKIPIFTGEAIRTALFSSSKSILKRQVK